MIALAEILGGLAPVDTGDAHVWSGAIPDTWLQGRTAYGGLSTAIALHVAMRSEPDLPPLRSAQVSFIGPLAGAVTVTATKLRRGRNAAFIQADVVSDTGLGLRATFVFMNAIESQVDHQADTLPNFTKPGPGDKTYSGVGVAFTQNFEFVDRREGDDLLPAEWLRWVRLKDREGLDPMIELVAMADCLPPAALRLVGRNVPMSSMTWLLNVLGPNPASDDGWWLLRSNADYARAGSSSQHMGVWNSAGEMVAEQMQSVVVFA